MNTGSAMEKETHRKDRETHYFPIVKETLEEQQECQCPDFAVCHLKIGQMKSQCKHTQKYQAQFSQTNCALLPVIFVVPNPASIPALKELGDRRPKQRSVPIELPMYAMNVLFERTEDWLFYSTM